MRKRKWVLILFLACVVVYVTGYAIWRLVKADEKIKDSLLEYLHPFLAEGSGIQKLGFTFGGIHLKGVTFIPKSRAFTLHIEDLQFRYSLWNLIRHRFNPNAVADKVFLLHPRNPRKAWILFLPCDCFSLSGKSRSWMENCF